MSRSSFVAASCLVLTAWLAGACGKYGAPHRTASPSAATPSASPIPPPYFGSQGSGVLNPTSEPLPVPTAPPEEPDEETTP